MLKNPVLLLRRNDSLFTDPLFSLQSPARVRKKRGGFIDHQRKGVWVGEEENRLKACLHGVGDPGLLGLVSFVFTRWGTQNKRNLPH